LVLPEVMYGQVDGIVAIAHEIKQRGYRHVTLLGMGGSSLAPEVFARTFGSAAGYPELLVLDSTHPAAVAAATMEIDPATALFVVSSKSGTTLETMSLFRTFWDRVARVDEKPGDHFIAITDPGTPLEQLATERGFRNVCPAPPDVGGRYSALSVFGLVPAALIGIDIRQLLERARTIAAASASSDLTAANPGLELGAALGGLALSGIDKVTFLATPQLASFPDWIEQLLAESTGKGGRGILPVASEPRLSRHQFSQDRLFVALTIEGASDDVERFASDVEQAGHPVVRIHLRDSFDLGQEMYRWEMAVAVAGAVLGIRPFDQPDVQLAKDLARRAMEGAADAAEPRGQHAVSTADPRQLGEELEKWAQAEPGDYLALQAYLAPNEETTVRLQEVRKVLGQRLGVATTLGYGPRFLHSTGQLHKGGPNTGLFLQLVDRPAHDVPVPETDYTFGMLIGAQALGDYQALQQRGRRILRVDLGEDAAAGLTRLLEALG
jgi:transaldolase/glucose-6-phosphate isomerase